MQIKTQTTTKIILELSKEEAYWLRSAMQNPLCDGKEEESDREQRSTLFLALDAILN